MSMMWVGIGSLAVGAGTTIYGANKQSKDNKAAQAQNAELQDKQNAAAWANYLMQRGLNPNGAVTGQIPTSGQAINTKLPLWASANFAAPGAKSRWVKKGTLPTRNTLARQTYTQAPALPASTTAAASSGSEDSSRLNDVLIGNPLGIGGKDRSFLDPLGIF